LPPRTPSPMYRGASLRRLARQNVSRSSSHRQDRQLQLRHLVPPDSSRHCTSLRCRLFTPSSFLAPPTPCAAVPANTRVHALMSGHLLAVCHALEAASICTALARCPAAALLASSTAKAGRVLRWRRGREEGWRRLGFQTAPGIKVRIRVDSSAAVVEVGGAAMAPP
jgi:hypothetical protein